MAGTIDRARLRLWEERFGLPPTNTLRIHRSQIDAKGYRRPGHLVGYNSTTDTLVYSRKVRDEDIVHELLHKLHPDLPHSRVRELTAETMEIFSLWEVSKSTISTEVCDDRGESTQN